MNRLGKNLSMADADNRLKGLGDVLQDSGVIQNDRLCRSIYIEWRETGSPCEVRLESVDM